MLSRTKKHHIGAIALQHYICILHCHLPPNAMPAPSLASVKPLTWAGRHAALLECPPFDVSPRLYPLPPAMPAQDVPQAHRLSLVSSRTGEEERLGSTFTTGMPRNLRPPELAARPYADSPHLRPRASAQECSLYRCRVVPALKNEAFIMGLGSAVREPANRPQKTAKILICVAWGSLMSALTLPRSIAERVREEAWDER
ncbi:hypothetical protein Pisl_1516 [Pyrobaculum islandicum DSM 4184]|uniref:Uncharacterized protein n=1 Tax=Pyrobaculum islandicum (strain DSM 4184 / JCM 9189 / GEO3) TaxID=384616 RepID=A1RUN9_PYRIL|nr:hypothetical protein Pisl_1516 [Pyrobaculum islandicum DSM 4184]